MSPGSKLEHISAQLPKTLDTEKHGTHRRCYQLNTNISRILKRENQYCNTDDAVQGPSTSKRRRSSTDISSTTVLFSAVQCLFCGKETITVKQKKQMLTKCVTKCAEESIKKAANDKCDEDMLLKIQNQDLVAREAHYHNLCRRKYTRDKTRHTTHENSEATKSQEAHKDSFEYLCRHIEDSILERQNVERLTMLKERYLAY